MDHLLQQIFNALQVGSVYALIALGYTLVYGILTMINFAHGDIFMVGSYAAFFAATLYLAAGMGPIPAFAATLVTSMFVTAFVALIIEKLAYRPLRNAPRISVVITSLGIGLFLENLFVAFKGIGPAARMMPPLIPDANFSLGSAQLSYVSLVIIAVSFFIMLCLDLLIRKTKTGMAMRAISFDKNIVPLMGIPVDRIISLTFALGAAIAAAGGLLYGMAYTIDPYMGIRIGWWAFISAVVGGIGNIYGAMLGGFILGFVEIFTPELLPSSTYRDIVAFSLLLILLILRPTGILGKKTITKV